MKFASQRRATDVYLTNDDQRQNGDPHTNLKGFSGFFSQNPLEKLGHT